MYTFDTTVQYGTAVNQVQYSTVHHAEQQKYIYCTVQYCILWMLHCKKSPSPVTHSKGGYYKDHASRLSPGGVWRFCILWLTIRTPCTKKRRKRRPASKTPDALPLRRRGQKDAGRLCLQYSRCYIFTTVHTGSVCTQK